MRRRSSSDASSAWRSSASCSLALPQPAGQRPRDRDLHQLEHDQRAERDRGEAAPDARAGRGNRVVAEVGLEQQPLPVRRPDRQVDLEQLLLGALETVLGAREIAHVGFDAPLVDRRDLVGAQLVPRSLELGLVGVDDHARLRVQIFTRTSCWSMTADSTTRATLATAGVPGEQAVGHRRFDEALGPNQRGRAGIDDRLALADPAAGDRGGEPDDQHRDEADEHELTDLPGHRPAPGDRARRRRGGCRLLTPSATATASGRA